jgi:glucan phosphoethanolaminetransferase (alkaline phosphatase superfamily)
VAYERLNLNEMSTELSLQNLFDKLMERNPFTLLREIYNLVDKDFSVYIPLTIFLLILMIIIVEFRVGTSSVWLVLSLIVAIVPLQVIRLANFVIEKDFLDVLTGLESYKNHMLPIIEQKLNVYTIIVFVIIVILFVLSKVLRKKVDTRIENVEETKHSRFVLARFAIFFVLATALFFNFRAAERYNMDMVNEIITLNPDEFEPQSVDLILREELNIDFDF